MTDDVQARIEELNKKIDQLMVRYQSANIPPPTAYRLGDNEFIFRVLQLVMSDLLKEKFEISDDEWDVLIKEHWIEQAEMMFKNTRKQQLQQQADITVPGKKLFLPPGIEL